MHWLRSHPYSLLAGFAGIIVLVIAAGIGASRPASVREPVAWGGAGELSPSNFGGGSAPASATTYNVLQPSDLGPYTIANSGSAATPSPNASELSAILAELSHGASAQTSATSSPQADALLQAVYTSVPSALLAPTNTPSTRDPEQQALYDYGNKAGLSVETFQNTHADMVSVLQAWIAARSDVSAQAGVQKIAQDLQQTGLQLSNITHVPAPAGAAAVALAASYQEVGAKLLAAVEAGDPSSFIDALKAYDASADVYTKHFLALADVFSAYGVHFSPSDPGSAFTFSATAGL